MTKEESFCFPDTFPLPAWPFPTPTLGVVLVSPESQNKSRGTLSSSPGPSEITPDSSLPSLPPPGGLPQVYTAWVAAPPTPPPSRDAPLRPHLPGIHVLLVDIPPPP